MSHTNTYTRRKRTIEKSGKVFAKGRKVFEKKIEKKIEKSEKVFELCPSRPRTVGQKKLCKINRLPQDLG
jgi:hypothetical protein